MVDRHSDSNGDEHSYCEAFTRLLNHGPVQTYEPHEWFNYVEQYGLGESDVPDLISLALGAEVDWNDVNQREAPIHAVRALGQLKDRAAAEYIVTLLDHDDYQELTDSVLAALTMMGPASIKALSHYFDWSDTSPWSQVVAADGFKVFALKHPQHRDECVQFLTQALAEHALQTPEVNGSLIGNLVDLRATESLAVIEQAFQSGRVEVGLSDTWANIQIEFGLATAADFTEAERLGYDPAALGASTEQPPAASKGPKPVRRRLSEIALAESYSMSEHLRR